MRIFKELLDRLEYFLWLIVLICGVFASIWLVTKFTAKSYEYGDIKDVSSGLVFYIDSETVVLSELNDETYGTKKIFSQIYQVDKTFDANKYNYRFELNNNLFPNTNINAGQIQCNLDLTFLSPEGEDILTDTLFLTINFYSNSSELIIMTKNRDALNYWNTYFNSYGFVLKVYREEVIK